WDEGIERLLTEAEATGDLETADLDALVEKLSATLKARPAPPIRIPDEAYNDDRITGVEWRFIDPKGPPPQGEGDRPQDRRPADPSANIPVEGVEAHSDRRRGLQPPQSVSPTAPPEGQQ